MDVDGTNDGTIIAGHVHTDATNRLQAFAKFVRGMDFRFAQVYRVSGTGFLCVHIYANSAAEEACISGAGRIVDSMSATVEDRKLALR